MEALSDAVHLSDVADSTADRIPSRPSSPQAEHSSPSTVAGSPLLHPTDSFHDDCHLPEHDKGYISSSSSTQQTSSDIISPGLDDEELAHLNSAVSSRSSVSSIPASVLIHPPGGIKSSVATGAHNNQFTQSWVDNDNIGYGKTDGFAKSVHTLRQREAAFRKPSSVRAMQMHTEDEEEDDFLTPPRRRGHRTSDISMRSAGSPLKRSPYYFPNGSGNKPKIKKEFPLVLLHCNLLAPSISVPAGVGTPSQKTLREVLPPQYWRRWRLLEERVGSGVLRDRGVLISHPQDMYDLLEERLLESLELQRPRLDKGHFLGQDETDSEKEDYLCKEEGATDDEQGEECPDCGGRVIRGSHDGKKWEIKVFAANGLMRAGAWAAAWKEMEKVDVQVSLWLPSDVRRELEKRLLKDEQSSSQHMAQMPREKELDNGPVYSSELKSNYGEQVHVPPQESRPADQEQAPRKGSYPATSEYNLRPRHEVDLQTLLVNYIRVLASDRRNIAISILSIVVVLLAIGGTTQKPISDLRPFPRDGFYFDPGTTIMPQYSTPDSEIFASHTIPSAPTTEASMALSTEPTESVTSTTAAASAESAPDSIAEETPIIAEESLPRADETGIPVETLELQPTNQPIGTVEPEGTAAGQEEENPEDKSEGIQP